MTLRDVPDDREEARQYVRTLEPGAERIVWLRMLGELEEAEALGWEQLTDRGGPASLDATAGDVDLPVDALAPAPRLAHVLHWQERFRDADVLFAAAIASASRTARTAPDGSDEERRATMMLAFAWQHLGKSRFDEGRFDEALGLFEQALDLRRRIGVPDDQIASSCQAIAAARARLADKSESSPP